ncbi:hypothetical protein [Bradyrhizobium sp. WSM1253]|uniref:hypothetical protein n=1 Tax=Bradyrhizobium sp. WSM1253 TaxID=319003 RepID=UPI0012F513AA|nr:hypothetical protein [Bradyrhizobium sp. WSM1253]
MSFDDCDRWLACVRVGDLGELMLLASLDSEGLKYGRADNPESEQIRVADLAASKKVVKNGH